MASTNGYTQSIRQNLVNKGVNNADIGYNPATNYVTVKGQDAIKSGKNYNGTNFTTQYGFNSDWDNYQKGQAQPASTETAYQAPTTQNYGAGPTQGYITYQTNNPYDTQLNDTIKMLMNQVNNQQPVDLNAIYASPQYAARQAQAQRGAQQGIRAAQESMGASGFGRSSALGERAQDYQNQANEYLELQALPELIAAEQQQRQQQLQNQLAMLGQLSSQQGVYDNRFNTANNYALDKGQLLGNFRDPRADEIIGKILAEKQNYANATDQSGRSLANQNATNYRNELAALGYDPALFGANQNLNQAQSNMSKFGQRTLAGQAQDYNQAVDARDFEFAKQQYERGVFESDRSFNEDLRRFGLDYALQQKAQALQAQNMAQDNARGWASIGLNRDEFNYRKEQDKLTGGKQIPFEQNPEFGSDIQYINSNPATALQELKDNAQLFIDKYGYDGYQALLKQATPDKSNLFTEMFAQ